MKGTQKQVAWANQIKNDVLGKLKIKAGNGKLTAAQHQALLTTAELKDAQWWIDNRQELRYFLVETIAEETPGYDKLPSNNKNLFF